MNHFSYLQVENEGKTIYSRIFQIIRFVCKCICFDNGSWIQSFGRLTWPRISDLIISNFLSKVWSSILGTLSSLFTLLCRICRSVHVNLSLTVWAYLSIDPSLVLETFRDVFIRVPFRSYCFVMIVFQSVMHTKLQKLMECLDYYSRLTIDS